MSSDVILLEMIPLAEEIKHGKGTPEKAARLAQLVLLLNDHLFNGGNLPQAWFVPLVTDFAPPDPTSVLDDSFEEVSGIHDIPFEPDLDFSCFDEPETSWARRTSSKTRFRSTSRA